MTLEKVLARLGALPEGEQGEIQDEALMVPAVCYFSYIALTICSVIFLASPSNIMVLSR
jgi:hypothetical protein